MATFDWVAKLDEVHPIKAGEYIKSNTPAWYNARRGRLTASVRAEQIYSVTRWSALREEIEHELSPEWERSEFDNAAMRWGRDNEPVALATLELETGLEIEDPGLVFHPKLPYVAGTPDGKCMRNGKLVSIQVKCPYNERRHLDNLYSSGAIDKKYFYQVQWEAWLLGAQEIMFVSFDPRQPTAAQLRIIDVPVDLDIQQRFVDNAIGFQRSFDAGVKRGTLKIDSGIPELF